MKLRHQSFITESKNKDLVIPNSQSIISQVSEPEKIKHTLIGSSKAIMRTIQILHKLGYANVSDWSPLLPTSNSEEFMSILIRSITVE